MIKYHDISFPELPGFSCYAKVRANIDSKKHVFDISIESCDDDKYAEFTTIGKRNAKRLLIEAYKGFYRRFVRAANKYNKGRKFNCIGYTRITDKDIKQDVKQFMNMI